MKECKNINNISEYVAEIRNNLGLGRTEFANFLGKGSAGERTIRGWETGEHKPSAKSLSNIKNLEKELIKLYENAPFKYSHKGKVPFTFIDLFAGIGGIRLPFQNLGGECLFTSEWDKFAQRTYLNNFGEIPKGDITKIKAKNIPSHDILLGGFPCQAFSQAGLKQGFNDTRGTMFFEIQRILVKRRPKAFLLENVKQLRGHDKGRTLQIILDILRGKNTLTIHDDVPMSEDARHALTDKLNYSVDFKVLRAADFDIPQNRERIFIIGFDKNYYGADFDINELFQWPIPPSTPINVGQILEKPSDLATKKDVYTISDKLWAGHKRRKNEHKIKGNGYGYTLVNSNSAYTNTISARYYKDGSEILIDQSELNKNPRLLTQRECANLQGFPKDFIVDAVSKGQMYKQFGNSVCTKVVEAVAKQMIDTMVRAEQVLPS